jgi:hypothetical protein
MDRDGPVWTGGEELEVRRSIPMVLVDGGVRQCSSWRTVLADFPERTRPAPPSDSRS